MQVEQFIMLIQQTEIQIIGVNKTETTYVAEFLTKMLGTDPQDIFDNIPLEWKELFDTMQEEQQLIISKISNCCFIPTEDKVLRIFRNLYPNEIKVVFLGQDPYPGIVKNINKTVACGLSFSAPRGPVPRSLKPIFLELKRTHGCDISGVVGDLSHWVSQGVFLLNTYLTIEYDSSKHKGISDSHSVWNCFTLKVLKYIALNTDAIFVLLGDKAQRMGKKSLTSKNTKIEKSHPVADFRSSKKSFLGSNLFVEIDKEVAKRGWKTINWQPLKIPLDDS